MVGPAPGGARGSRLGWVRYFRDGRRLGAFVLGTFGALAALVAGDSSPWSTATRECSRAWASLRW
ncbi:hypothetical protein [Nesterenkonia pannonica]|uniref:hypothetical protein n=1 Tax=Nesterenkonia pannonica TaxID=1548602 RepID=UPI0021645D83|nr:hypothetical protein [Nesterenkonia pannonica]